MRHFCLSLFVLLSVVTTPQLFAQQYELVPVGSEADIVDGATYFITSHPSKSSKKYESLKLVANASGREGLMTLIGCQPSEAYDDPKSACAASDLFEIKSIGANRYLYSKTIGQYIGMDTIGYSSDALVADTPHVGSKLRLEKSKTNQLLLKFNDYRYLLFTSSNRCYGFYRDPSQAIPVLLYRLVYDSTDTLVIDSSGLSAPVHRRCHVVYRRQLHDNSYNTLCLPFDIADYKTVFGQQTAAYEAHEANDSSIVFRPVSGRTLTAGTPYLLYGLFSGRHEFFIANAEVDYDGSFTARTPMGPMFLTTVWQPQTISRDPQAFILYKNRFVSARHQQRVAIGTGQWYVSTSPTGRKQLRLSIGRHN